MKLITIPYAAGTRAAFYPLCRSLNAIVEMDVFEYPGHGQKISLPLLNSIPEIAKEMLSQMFPIFEPYCLLGYSMGGHVLCELYRMLLEKNYPLPAHVFLCAIDIPNQEPKEISDISDQTLRNELSLLGGTSAEILGNREFMEMLLPIYRADIVAERKYVLPYKQLFRCEGTVIVGETEWNDENHFSEWRRYFIKTVQFHIINGGHFFMLEEPEAFMRILVDSIKAIK